MGRIGLSVLIVVAGFLYLPLVVLTVFSFNDSALMAFPLSGFTLEWYRELAQNDNFLKGFITSFLMKFFKLVGFAESASFANGHLGIELTEVGADCLQGRMPVDARTQQPAGILHGGASVLFA